MSGWIERLAGRIYVRLSKSRFFELLAPLRLRRNIEFCGMEIQRYYEDKIALFLKVLLGGLLLIALQGAALYLQREQVTVLERPAAGQSSDQEELWLEEEGTAVQVEVYARELTKEEADESFEALLSVLEQMILGENESFAKVTEDLTLPDSVGGYPFTLTWSSLNWEIISSEGEVDREGLTEDIQAELRLRADYGGWQWYYTFSLTVSAPVMSTEQEYLYAVEALLKESEEESRGKEQWELPEELEGAVLKFYRNVDYSSLIWLALLLLLLPPLLWAAKDQDLWEKRKKRRSRMESAYPEFISRLSLYIAAGLNLQRAMAECAADYQQDWGQEKLLGKELSDFMKRMKDGYSFYQALEAFAEACDEEHYKKLAGLLRQAEKNSMRGLARMLEQEAAAVQEEQRRDSRARGDRISDKLLGPMMLQLAIVMGLIMVPAFLSF
ncbi:MAG: type II secretion system F family protein [Lachnospiraceae bacterium]|nr:type II secretion system F family protein [Lachnospiraceae bacterium]